jgi:hypothetical protein
MRGREEDLLAGLHESPAVVEHDGIVLLHLPQHALSRPWDVPFDVEFAGGYGDIITPRRF